jgi:heme-degrading monooxygenase HmoA
MHVDRTGQTAVIFTSFRSGADADGYESAAAAMDALAMVQPGYRGVESTRGADGMGITISYWSDDTAAIAWRDHPDHSAIRERGRAIWYDSYSVTVAHVARGYGWTRP